MVKFSILLILIAFLALGLMLAPMVSPNDTSLLNLLEPVLCDSGDTLLQEVASNARRVDSTSNAFVVDMSLLCKRADATTYNVTEKLVGIGVIVFMVFLLFGVLFLIIGIIRNLSGGNKPQPVSTAWTPPYYPPQSAQTPGVYAQSTPGLYPQPTVTNSPPLNYGSSYPTSAAFPATTVSASVEAPSDKFDFESASTMLNLPKPPSAAPTEAPASGTDLSNRLKQLRDAYDAGLISHEEFERSKSDLLRDFTDDN